MSFTRRRSERPDPARRRLRSNLESLESRQLLSGTPYYSQNGYPLQDFLTEKPPGKTPAIQIAHPIGTNPAILATYQNQGKVLSGQDRQGNRWQLTLTGPGQIIVTDTTPNDGVLDDDINTITLIGTDPKLSSLHGEVQQSARTPTSYTQLPTLGTVRFNRLYSNNGLHAIVLNGFELTDTITPPGSTSLSPAESFLNQTTGIVVNGPLDILEFGGIDGRFPASFNPQPIAITIGKPTSPILAKPNIRIDHIYNTVYDDTAFQRDPTTGFTPSSPPATIPTGPLTSPTITLFVNGRVQSLNVVSITQEPNLGTLFPPLNNSILKIPTQLIPIYSAALEYQFPIVGTTGRTAVQVKSINKIKVNANATNTTFSRSTTPFQNSLTGLDNVGSAQFGGTTDAVAIDSRGNIGTLRFAKGIGNPTGSSKNPIYYGTPAAKYGYAASGNSAVQVSSEGNIGKLEVAPNDQFLQVNQDPARIQSGQNGYTTYVNRPGTAIQTSLVTAAKSIGPVHVVGNVVNSEIKSGYSYASAVTGTDPVNGASAIGPVTQRGDLVNSVYTASYRPVDSVYGNGNDQAGNGTITGVTTANTYVSPTTTTPLGNIGAGFYSKYTAVGKHPQNPKVVKTK